MSKLFFGLGNIAADLVFPRPPALLRLSLMTFTSHHAHVAVKLQRLFPKRPAQ